MLTHVGKNVINIEKCLANLEYF